jgi:16S rRNA processing protein RimM
MAEEVPRRLEVGRIGRPHGLHGEVTVTLVTNHVERTDPGTVLYAGDRALVVEASRPHKQGWLVRFAGVDHRDAAEALRGAVLHADRVDAREGEVWVHDLVGAEVVDRAGRALGTVVAVEANPAHELLVVDERVLVPMPFVVEVTPGRVVVDPPDGLLDL